MRVHPYTPFTTRAAMPKPKTVAIIGAGWCGTQACEVLSRNQDVTVHVYERLNDVGGTWHPTKVYSSQHVHSAAWFAEFYQFPLSAEERARRAYAKEVFAYNRKFTEAMGVLPKIRFNSQVVRVDYNSTTGKSRIVVRDVVTSQEEDPGFEYDLVVDTSFACEPNIPSWPGQEKFQGRVIHASQLNDQVLADAKERGLKVLVVGGSKSACDMLMAFHQADYDSATQWLSRSDYHFVNYKALFHGRTVYGIIRSSFALMGMAVGVVSGPFSLMFMHLVGFTTQPKGFANFDINKFHFGCITAEERAVLHAKPRIKSEIKNFTEKGVALKNGRTLDVDLIVCATGNKLPSRSLVACVDGVPVQLDAKERAFEGLVLAKCPGLAVCGNNPYSFGVKRGASAADHIAMVLARELTWAEIKRGSRRTRMLQLDRQFLFDGSANFIFRWFIVYIDLWRSDLLSLYEAFTHVAGIFVSNHHVPLQLHVPKAHRRRVHFQSTSSKLEPGKDADSEPSNKTEQSGVAASVSAHLGEA